MNTTISLAILYLIVNVVVLLWFLIDPTGFWGIFWFYGIVTIGFSVLVQLLIIMLSALVKESRKNFGIIGIGIFLAFAIIGSVLEFGPTLLISKKLRDRYRYIEVSNRYFDEGKYDKAIKTAEKLYSGLPDTDTNNSSPWVLKNYFLTTGKGKNIIHTRRYQATVNYAYCLVSLGSKLDEAEKLFLECERHSQNYYKNEIEYSVVPLIGRSLIHMYREEIVETERIYNVFTTYLSDLEGEDLTMALSMMVLYSQFSQKHGDVKKAEDIRKHVLHTYELSDKSIKSTFYLTILLAVVEDNLRYDLLEEAKPLLEKAKKIAKEKRKKVIFRDYLNQQASFAEKSGLIDEAEKLYKSALRHSRRMSSIELSYQQTVYAGFLFGQRRFEEAKQYNISSLNHSKSDSGVNIGLTQFLGIILSNYATNDAILAKSQAIGLDSLVKGQVNEFFMYLSSDEKVLFTHNIDRALSVTNSIYLGLKDSSVSGNIYNNVLAAKSIGLFSNLYTEEFLLSSGNKAFSEKYQLLRKEKRQLEDRLLIQKFYNPELMHHIDSITFAERSIIEQINDLEGFKPFDISEITWDEIQNSLNSDESAIEFIYTPEQPHIKSSNHYYALIINPNFDFPVIVPLFLEESLKLLLQNSQALEEGINSLYSDSTTNALKSMIWAPLRPYIKDSKKVYISLSGLLHQISFPALTINESCNVDILSSTRVLIDKKKKRDKTSFKAVLIGDVDYNYQKRSSDISDLTLYRTLDSNLPISLPGTRLEIDFIAELMEANENMAVLLTGSEATEVAFRRINALKPSIIHIASHGFYYPEERSIIMRDNIFHIENDYTAIIDPMQRSGLLFASSAIDGEFSFQTDGILTSNEISGLDLQGVDLVVLSACETGLGDVRGSEGVFGLQRAFKIAGVRTLIMSLWKVPDRQTAELMTYFYQYYLSGYSASDSLKKAQIEMRKIYPDPFTWASFYVVD